MKNKKVKEKFICGQGEICNIVKCGFCDYNPNATDGKRSPFDDWKYIQCRQCEYKNEEKGHGHIWELIAPASQSDYCAWQVCPICGGTGQITNSGTTSSPYTICSVCNGEKIINTLTGRPPA